MTKKKSEKKNQVLVYIMGAITLLITVLLVEAGVINVEGMDEILSNSVPTTSYNNLVDVPSYSGERIQRIYF